MTKKKILFVCLGNIVRSPLAEHMFQDMVSEEGLEDKYETASAGIEPWHVGEAPDTRMVGVAAQRGMRYSGAARQITRADMTAYDLILVMDDGIRSALLRLANGNPPPQHIHLLRDYDPQSVSGLPIPDPYYGGLTGFEMVFDLIKRACRGLLDSLESGDRPGR